MQKSISQTGRQINKMFRELKPANVSSIKRHDKLLEENLVRNSHWEQLVQDLGRRKRLLAEYQMSKSPHSDKNTDTVQKTIHSYEANSGLSAKVL